MIPPKEDIFFAMTGSIPWKLGVRGRIRGFIEELLEAELDWRLGRDPMNGEARAAQLF